LRRALLIGIRGQFEDPEGSLDELRGLCHTAGYEVAEVIFANVQRPNPATYIGSGKLEEVARMLSGSGAAAGERTGFPPQLNPVIVDSTLSAVQARNLENRLSVAVLDRTNIILEIFAERAHTHEGRLQVELATLLFLMPRLTHRGAEMSRLGGIVGTRGPGEPYFEKHRRALRRRIDRLRKQLDSLSRQRATRRLRRHESGIPTAAIVGYTNVGKSSVLNLLTAARVPTDDRLFATLDPTTRRLYLPDIRAHILLTDTVGFIRNLPHSLVEAFKATLEEVTMADFVLLVVDASSPVLERQMAAVNEVLTEIGAADKPRLTVFNKMDLLDESARAGILVLARAYEPSACISVRSRDGIQTLLRGISLLVRRHNLVATAPDRY
jgi:GTP-binding protein HflX